MKDNSLKLHQVVSITLLLLQLSAVLIVLGICDAFLDWNIFPPEMEKVLYAIFGCFMVMAAMGIGATLTLSARELVFAVRQLGFCVAKESLLCEPALPFFRRWAWLGGTVMAAAILLGGFSIANSRSDLRQISIFKKVSAEQFSSFAPKITAELGALSAPPHNNVPPKLYEYIKALRDLTAFGEATLYLPDPVDADIMWGYTTWRGKYDNADGFARFYAVKAFEKAMLQAVHGKPEALDKINANAILEYYGLLSSAEGKPLGVLRLDGQFGEDYRSYAAE